MSNDYDDALKTIAKGAGIAFFGITLNRFLAFLSKVVVARFLTPSEYGVLNLGLAIFSIFIIISLVGIPEGIVRYIPYYTGRKEYGKVKGVIHSSIKISLPLSFIFSGLMFYLSHDISKIFHNAELSYVLEIFSLAIPFWILTRIYMAANVGFKRVEYSIMTETLHQLIRFVMVISFLLAGFGLVGASFGYLLAFLVSPLIGYYFFSKLFLLIKECDIKPVGKEVFSYSWPLLLAGFSSLILSWTDTLMLGYFKNEYYVGIYNAAYPIAQLLTIFGVSFSSIFLPVITEFYSAGSFDNLKRTYTAVTKWVFGLTFPTFLILVFFGKWVIKILFGIKYVSGYSALSVLALGFFTSSVLALSSGVIKSLGKTKFIMINSYFIAALNVALNTYLIPTYGVTGAAIATAISAITSSIICFAYSCRLVRAMPISSKCLRSIPAAVTALVIVYALAKIVLQLGLLTLIPNLIFYFIIYFSLLLVFRYFDYEDVIIMKAIESKIGLRLGFFKRIITRFL